MSPLRSASLSDYVNLAQSLGLDFHSMMRQVGLSPRCLDDPETLVSTESVRELLENSAHATGVEDFALRLAARRTLSNLGPISLVLKEESTPRQALDTLCRYLRLINPSLIVQVEDAAGTVTIREEMLGSQSLSMRQPMELAVGVMFRILRELVGPQWRPLRVCFVHRPPRDLAGHRAFFGTRVDFNQEFNGLVCAAADLRTRHAHADTGISRFARDHLDRALSRHSQGARDTVRQLIAALLPGGRCTAQQVAQHLNVDRRTLHRHLAAEGTTFSELLDEVRSELVLRHLRDSDLPLSAVASLLGFSAPSAFSHWFRSAFGRSVTQSRRLPQPPQP
ncbi:AraC family transcriptional regulator [Polaromonas sp. C04]|uniref:AraC family transcriptional regulator n=1 Tax=Polaromonas sp. C04 TaxID=1945857 RepID=UPI000985A88A|nr:AraC family transcriptional regulator [Polaromonas sp. C04]OOG58736.1 AraC family transcriptional regulator [Polaromonas sp. C04]